MRIFIPKNLTLCNYFIKKKAFSVSTDVRNKTMFYFFLFTGLRLSELMNLKLQDINFMDYYVTVIKGKGNKSRQVPLIDLLYSRLLDYLEVRNKCFGNDEDGILFPSKSGLRLWKNDVRAIFLRIQKKIPFKLTPHMLRHTFATELVRKDINLYKISR